MSLYPPLHTKLAFSSVSFRLLYANFSINVQGNSFFDRRPLMFPSIHVRILTHTRSGGTVPQVLILQYILFSFFPITHTQWLNTTPVTGKIFHHLWQNTFPSLTTCSSNPFCTVIRQGALLQLLSNSIAVPNSKTSQQEVPPSTIKTRTEFTQK